MLVDKALILFLTTLLTSTHASPLTPASSPTPTMIFPPSNTSYPPSTTSCPFLCVDYINECGQWYGGCVEHYCPGDPMPEYTDPGCPSSSSSSSSASPASPTSYPEAAIDDWKRESEPTSTADNSCLTCGVATPAEETDEACPTVCYDGVNKCGIYYGGCVPHCYGQPLPTFAPPPCPEE